MSRKRRRGGKALARWESGGQPAGGGSVADKAATAPKKEQPKQLEAPPAVERPALPPDDDDTLLRLEPPGGDGWGISYDKHEGVDARAPRRAEDGTSHTAATTQQGEQGDGR